MQRAGGPDDEVVTSDSSHLAGPERLTEPCGAEVVARRRGAAEHIGVQDHADGAGQDGHAAADACILVAGRPDREVVVAVAVEVPGHDRGTELVELVLIGERSEAAIVLREPSRLAGDADVARLHRRCRSARRRRRRRWRGYRTNPALPRRGRRRHRR